MTQQCCSFRRQDITRQHFKCRTLSRTVRSQQAKAFTSLHCEPCILYIRFKQSVSGFVFCAFNIFVRDVFPNNDVKIYSIDECDFKGGLHSLKYHFVKNRFPPSTVKTHDFGYWGTSKKKKVGGELSGDERHIILKDLHKSDLNTLFIGNFDGFKRDVKFTRKLENIVPHLMNCKTTLCFNWPGYDEYLTSRYNEAVACDIIPLVWKNYDVNNQLVESEWQRCNSFEDVQRKCLELRDESVRLEYLNRIKEKYKESTEDIRYYEQEFEKKLKGIIDD